MISVPARALPLKSSRTLGAERGRAVVTTTSGCSLITNLRMAKRPGRFFPMQHTRRRASGIEDVGRAGQLDSLNRENLLSRRYRGKGACSVQGLVRQKAWGSSLKRGGE